MTRKTVNPKIQTNILTKSRRRCALCFGLEGNTSEKRGQIAHIDGNNQNNRENNLVFLCLNCHDKYDSTNSQSKGHLKDELLYYKNQLEKWVKLNFPLPNLYLSEYDIELYEEIKKYFMNSGVLTNINNFYFGQKYHIDDFMISNGLFGSDLINIYDKNIPPITFQNKELEQEFERFKYWYCEFEALMSTTYQSDPNNFMFYNSSYYNYSQKQEHIKIFEKACENIFDSFSTIKDLIEK